MMTRTSAAAKLASNVDFERPPTDEERERFAEAAFDRIQRKYPERFDAQGVLISTSLNHQLVDCMIVWMAETPGWERFE
jgi:hypothetical protein